MDIIQIITLLIAILSIGALMLAFSNRFGISFTVSLVLVGAALAHTHEYGPEIYQTLFTTDISPNIIFYICLPTLIFESAYNLDAKELRQNIVAILFLAVPGLLISTFLIGGITHIITGISFMYCLLLGAILSATDPVAVISIFKKLGAPKKLTILVEGESLLNDATSIVTAKIILTIILAGTFTSHQIWVGVEHFLIEFIGGLLVGIVLAIVTGVFLTRVEHSREIEISLTTILAYGSFLLAQEYFHVSGVTATVESANMRGTLCGKRCVGSDM